LIEETLQGVLENAAECEPVLRSALRHWAYADDAPDPKTLRLIVAVLGEISGPDAVDELLELSNTGDKVLFAHVHWAISGLGQRHTAAVLGRFRVAARGAGVGLRCALADQLNLLDDVEGDVDLLTSLVDDFETIAKESDAPYLLAVVIHALVERQKLVL